MNDTRDISGSERSALQTLIQTGAVRFLLLGMYVMVASLLGRRMSRAERRHYRERAWRVRKAVAEVRRVQNMPENNRRFMAQWSGDDDCRRWNRRMWPVWQYSRANHPPKYRRIARHVRTFMRKFWQGFAEAHQTGLQTLTPSGDNQKSPAPP